LIWYSVHFATGAQAARWALGIRDRFQDCGFDFTLVVWIAGVGTANEGFVARGGSS
jgi:hypothetical protein